MYQVNLGSKILYYPANADYSIYDTELTEDVGQAGEFRFKVPSSNPEYGNLTTGALITILKDKKEFWRGEIKEINTNFAKVADVYCLEDVSWLGDEFLTPAHITNESYAQRFQAPHQKVFPPDEERRDRLCRQNDGQRGGQYRRILDADHTARDRCGGSQGRENAG